MKNFWVTLLVLCFVSQPAVYAVDESHEDRQRQLLEIFLHQQASQLDHDWVSKAQSEYEGRRFLSQEERATVSEIAQKIRSKYKYLDNEKYQTDDFILHVDFFFRLAIHGFRVAAFVEWRRAVSEGIGLIPEGPFWNKNRKNLLEAITEDIYLSSFERLGYLSAKEEWRLRDAIQEILNCDDIYFINQVSNSGIYDPFRVGSPFVGVPIAAFVGHLSSGLINRNLELFVKGFSLRSGIEGGLDAIIFFASMYLGFKISDQVIKLNAKSVAPVLRRTCEGLFRLAGGKAPGEIQH